MNDLDATRLCAEAMGFPNVHIATACRGTQYVKHTSRSITANTEYRPLHDDAQAFALVKRFPMQTLPAMEAWIRTNAVHELNRCIVYTVAVMQKEREMNSP